MKGTATLFLLVGVLCSQYVNAETEYTVYYLKDFVAVSIFSYLFSNCLSLSLLGGVILCVFWYTQI